MMRLEIICRVKVAFIVALCITLISFAPVNGFAQEAGEEENPLPRAEDITDSQIDSFLRVDLAAQSINIEVARQIRAVLDTENMTVEQYNVIAQLLNQDNDFLERIKARTEKMSEEFRKREAEAAG